MAIPPLQLPGYAQPTAVDWTPLSKLGDIIQSNRLNNNRKEALSLATLGKEPGAQPDYSKSINALIGANDIEGAAKIAAIQKAVSPESSADLQAYKVAKGQGFQGGILDFLKDKAAAGATRVNNNTTIQSGEKAYDTAVGKDYADVFTGIQKSGRDSVGAINNLTLMSKLMANRNFYSGAGGPLVTQAKKIATSLGIADADSAAPNEVFQKLAQKTVLDAAGGSLGTGFSNADRDFLNGTVANISNTPAGNKQIIQNALTVENRKQQVAQFARDYAKKHGGRVDAGFDQALQDWSNAHPAFPQAQIKPAATAGPQNDPLGIR
jgi:hypothetical protein